MSTDDRIVRVASGQGFWGDWLDAPRRQVEGGEVPPVGQLPGDDVALADAEAGLAGRDAVDPPP